jgi:hypothetical protein
MTGHTPKEQTFADMVKDEDRSTRRRQQLNSLEPVVDISLWYQILSTRWQGEIEVYDVRAKITENGQDPWLFIVKGTSGDGSLVIAFHSDGDFLVGLASLARRLAKGHMKWREDKPYED